MLSLAGGADETRLRDPQNLRCPTLPAVMNSPDREIEDIDDHEDLIYTALPDYNPAACLLESDAEEDETEVKKFTTS